MTNGTNSKLAKGLLVAAVLIAGTAFYFHWNNDIRKVQRRFEKLLDTVKKAGTESLPVMAAKTHKTISYFALDAVIEPGYPFSRRIDRTELKAVLMNGRRQVTSLKIDVLGYDAVEIEPGIIQMDVSLDVAAEGNGYGDNAVGTYRIRWAHIDGNWLISNAEPLDIVKHPDKLIMP